MLCTVYTTCLFLEEQGVLRINEALDSGSPRELIEALQNPAAQLPEVHSFAGLLYLEEFTNMKNEKLSHLDYDEIHAGVLGNKV